MGAGGGPARVPHNVAGMGEAHRLAGRHAEARLETAARLQRGHRDGGDLRPHQGRSRARRGAGLRRRAVTARWHCVAVAVATACASGRGRPTARAPPAPPAPPYPPSTPPPPPPPPPPRPPPPLPD